MTITAQLLMYMMMTSFKMFSMMSPGEKIRPILEKIIQHLIILERPREAEVEISMYSKHLPSIAIIHGGVSSNWLDSKNLVRSVYACDINGTTCAVTLIPVRVVGGWRGVLNLIPNSCTTFSGFRLFSISITTNYPLVFLLVPTTFKKDLLVADYPPPRFPVLSLTSLQSPLAVSSKYS